MPVNLSVSSSVYNSSEDVSSLNYSGVNSSHNNSINDTTLNYDNSNDLSYDSQDTVIYSEIKILSLNAGGLKSKLNNPEWEETVMSYDIVCIQETHFDAFDSIDMLGFRCLTLMNRGSAKIKSGGIAILVKEHLYDSIKVLKNDGDHFYWFTLINHFAYDVAFCCVYIAKKVVITVVLSILNHWKQTF